MVNISVKCHQGKGQRGKAVMRRRVCPSPAQASSPEVDKLSCLPENQQSQPVAGVKELAVNLYKISVYSVHINNKVLSG